MKNLILIALLVLISVCIQAAPLGEYFTYQGELLENNQPANGNYDMLVNFYETQTAGTSLGGNLSSGTNVINGIFSIELDIGSTPFIGDEIWIQLSIKPAGTGSYTDLPRQKITNTPYAIHSQFVGSFGVNSDAIQTSAVTTFKIADAAVTNSKLANSSVTGTKIAGNAIKSVHIEDGTIVAADIDNSSVQQRINGTCATGSSIQSIAANGTVTCEVDDTGVSGWGLTGNSGINPATNFIGTEDNQDFIIRTNNNQAMKFVASGNNVILGDITNSVGSGIENSSISGGKGNTISAMHGTFFATIAGGEDNSIVSTSFHARGATISGGIDNNAERELATVGGGRNNEARGVYSTVSGGSSNIASGDTSTIPGGANNFAGGEYSFAAGQSAKVRDATATGDSDGDEGTFVWSSGSVYFTSTGPEQFLIDADGGVGIGTNAPASPMHVKGQGKTFGVLTNEVVMTIEPEVMTHNVSLAINRLEPTNESALVFTTNKSPEFDIRNISGGKLDFNSYESGSASFMMRIHDSITNRIDFNANIEPQVTDSYNFGSAGFRWKHIYTEDITTRNTITTDSDRRLKDNIKDLDYGLADILSIRPVSYKLKKGNPEQTHLGFIAQEIKTIVPEIVSQTDDEKHMLSMRYSELIPILIKATQEQQALIDQQQQQIKELQSMVEGLVKNQKNK